MTYVKNYLPPLKTHVVNLNRDAKDLSHDLQRLEVRGKLGSKTLYCMEDHGYTLKSNLAQLLLLRMAFHTLPQFYLRT